MSIAMPCDAAPKRAIVISDLGRGGSQRVATRLAAAWRDAGCDVVIITLAAPAIDDITVPTGIRRIALAKTGVSHNSLAGIVANLRRIMALRRAIREFGTKLVVSFLAATNVLTILATQGLGVTVVVSERNDPARQRLGFAWDMLRRAVYRFAGAVTANSQRAMTSLQSYVPKSKLALVPNYPPEWPDEPPPAEEREHIILAVGRLHEQKAFDRLLPMFAASKGASSGWRLAILGEGDGRKSIENLRDQLELSNAVILPGYQRNIKPWYDRAAVFVMMSNYEGTANALIEAISRGLPVVVSDTSGDGPDYVKRLKCGFVINARNPSEGAAVLDRLMNDALLRKELGNMGRAGVASLMPSHEITRLWEDVLVQATLRTHPRFSARAMRQVMK
jgi:GalNAc-alpha-(1->4)-GalNAc-alpha-(1->3)-diNAcBac-PP-undecaprenol alpha-1,4-N-acetyl-D-galactosaminyltransferase